MTDLCLLKSRDGHQVAAALWDLSKVKFSGQEGPPLRITVTALMTSGILLCSKIF